MTGIKCRGCAHDQNDHKEKLLSTPGSKSQTFTFRCLNRGCECCLDGSASDEEIRRVGQPQSRIILPGNLQKQLQAQLDQQAAVGVAGGGMSPDDFKTTDPEALLNAPIGGPKIEDS